MNATPTTKTFPQAPLKELDSAQLVFQLSHYKELIAHETGVNGEINQEASNAIASAMEVASFLHAGQTRRNRGNLPVTPYIEHPLRVALRICRWGYRDYELVVAALLHDVLEDCAEKIKQNFCVNETPYQWIERSYGHRVAEIVQGVTNNHTPYIEKIEKLTRQASENRINLDKLIVKAGDMVDNAGSLMHQVDETTKSYAKHLRLALKYKLPLIMIQSALVNASEEAVNTEIINPLHNTAMRINAAYVSMNRAFPEIDCLDN